MDRLENLVSTVEDTIAFAKSESRALTEGEYELVQDYIVQADALAEGTAYESRVDAILEKLEPRRHKNFHPLATWGLRRMGERTGSSDKDFPTFASQMLAIREAGIPGGKVNPKLYDVRAATGMSESVGPDGGFLVVPQYSQEILRVAFDVARFAPLCRNIPIGNSNTMRMNIINETSRANGSRWGGILGYWLNEAADKVASKPTFRQLELNLKKLVCLCYATDELLEDVPLLDQTLRQGFSEEFAFRIDDAILNGSGAGMPLGITQSGCLVQSSRTTAGTLLTDDVVAMWSRLVPGSHARAFWLINPDSLPTLYKMDLGTASDTTMFIAAGGLPNVPAPTLLGRPILISDLVPSIASANSLMLCDFSYYLLITKGSKFDVSQHYRWINDESVFRGVTRIDGQPMLASAIAPKVGSLSLSPFVGITA